METMNAVARKIADRKVVEVLHWHCPWGCENPSPAPGMGGNLYCLECWHLEGRLTEMVSCTAPECKGCAY